MTRHLHPLDVDEARAAARMASENQRNGEQQLRDAFRGAAAAEQEYRKALAVAIVKYREAGTAWSVCADMARGDAEVAQLRYERDVKDGVKEAALQATWRHAADRKDVGRMIDWSRGRDLATGAEPEPPAEPHTFGGRRAA